MIEATQFVALLAFSTLAVAVLVALPGFLSVRSLKRAHKHTIEAKDRVITELEEEIRFLRALMKGSPEEKDGPGRAKEPKPEEAPRVRVDITDILRAFTNVAPETGEDDPPCVRVDITDMDEEERRQAVMAISVEQNWLSVTADVVDEDGREYLVARESV